MSEIVPSKRNGQFVAWTGHKFTPNGWVVGESADGETFYINAQAYDTAFWDFTLSRRALNEEAQVIRLKTRNN